MRIYVCVYIICLHEFDYHYVDIVTIFILCGGMLFYVVIYYVYCIYIYIHIYIYMIMESVCCVIPNIVCYRTSGHEHSVT